LKWQLSVIVVRKKLKHIIPFFSSSLPVYAYWRRGKTAKSLPLTFHPEYEFHFVKQGRGAYYIEGKTYSFCAKHLVIIRPNQIHSFIPQTGNCLEKATLIFKSECLKSFLHSLKIDKTFPALIGLADYPAMHMEMIVNHILEENSRRKKGWEEMTRELLCLFLLWVKRLKNQPKEPRKEKPLFVQLRRHVESHFADPRCNVTRIAKDFGYSLNYLSALFKETSGIGIKHYLLQYRIIAARKILDENPEMKIEGIARQVGFNQYRNFNRAFIKLTGISPSIYRKNYHLHREK